jgi:hypothetical protein
MARFTNTPDESLDLTLFCGQVLVGDLLNVIVHQGTWFALEFRQAVRKEVGRRERRICEYIAFSNEWHERLRKQEDPDPSEYDRFGKLAKSGSWSIRSKDGEEIPIDSPGFIGKEVSWRVPACDREPSPEVAAWELWSRLTKRCT